VSFGDGFWVVGHDIAAGMYKSNGAEPDIFEFCMATMYFGEDETSQIQNVVTANAGEPFQIELDGKLVNAVSVSGCESFTKVN